MNKTQLLEASWNGASFDQRRNMIKGYLVNENLLIIRSWMNLPKTAKIFIKEKKDK